MPDFRPGTSGGVRNSADSTKVKIGSTTYFDLPLGANPYAYVDRFWDFEGGQNYYEVDAVLGENVVNPGANIISSIDTQFSIAEVPILRGGRLVSATFLCSGGIAANDTNFVTFTVTNKFGAGAGAVAMLAATQTSKSASLGAITSLVPYPLTISATPAALAVASGDVLEVKVLTGGTLANVLNAPVIRLKFATIDPAFVPRATRALASPLVGPVDSTANGEHIITLNAASEAQTAGFDFGDLRPIPANRGWVFEALVKVNTTAITTNQQVLIGMASAYNATFASIISNAWFFLNASMIAQVESDDGTADNDGLSTGQTLVADTYYMFRIDATNRRAVTFWINNKLVKTLSAAAWAVTDLLQPVFYVRKASGATTPSISVDAVRIRTNRAS